MNEPTTSGFDFGRIAARYDAWYQTPPGAMYDRLEKRAVARLLPSAGDGDRLLEVGCGTGHWSEFFCRMGFQVTGVDLSEEMVAIARRRGIRHGVFSVADGARLSFADDGFDVAAAVTVLEFVANPRSVLSEMVRCVKKDGGTLIVGVLNRLSAYNRRRKQRPTSPYASANLFGPAELKSLLAPYGEPRVLVAGFGPPWDSLVWLSPLLESVARLMGNERGAFLAARVTL